MVSIYCSAGSKIEDTVTESFFDPQIVFPLKTGFVFGFPPNLHCSLFRFLILHWSLPGKCYLIIIIISFLDPPQDLSLGHMTVQFLFSITLFNCNARLGQPLWDFKIVLLKMEFLYLACITCFITKIFCTNFTWAHTPFLSRISPLILKKVQHVLAT